MYQCPHCVLASRGRHNGASRHQARAQPRTTTHIGGRPAPRLPAHFTSSWWSHAQPCHSCHKHAGTHLRACMHARSPACAPPRCAMPATCTCIGTACDPACMSAVEHVHTMLCTSCRAARCHPCTQQAARLHSPDSRQLERPPGGGRGAAGGGRRYIPARRGAWGAVAASGRLRPMLRPGACGPCAAASSPAQAVPGGGGRGRRGCWGACRAEGGGVRAPPAETIKLLCKCLMRAPCVRHTCTCLVHTYRVCVCGLRVCAQDGLTALLLAARSGHAKVVDALLAAGAGLEARAVSGGRERGSGACSHMAAQPCPLASHTPAAGLPVGSWATVRLMATGATHNGNAPQATTTDGGCVADVAAQLGTWRSQGMWGRSG